MKLEIEMAIRNLIRLNNIRRKHKFDTAIWKEFLLYKNIVKNNANESELTDDVKNIISK